MDLYGVMMKNKKGKANMLKIVLNSQESSGNQKYKQIVKPEF